MNDDLLGGRKITLRDKGPMKKQTTIKRISNQKWCDLCMKWISNGTQSYVWHAHVSSPQHKKAWRKKMFGR